MMLPQEEPLLGVWMTLHWVSAGSVSRLSSRAGLRSTLPPLNTSTLLPAGALTGRMAAGRWPLQQHNTSNSRGTLTSIAAMTNTSVQLLV